MKKIISIVLICLFMISCATIPIQYAKEPTRNEMVYIETASMWGIVFTLISGYTYWYLDNKANYY